MTMRSRLQWADGTRLIAVVAMVVAVAEVRGAVVRECGPFRLSFYSSGESDGTNSGTQGWTTQQMDDVCYAVNVWDSVITNTPGRMINLHLFWRDFGNNSILGGSYSPTNGDGTTTWTYAEHVWRDGVNYSAPWSAWDGFIIYDTDAAGCSWNFGAAVPGTGQIDFRSVVTHELGHNLGFSPTYDSRYDDWGNGWGTSTSPYGWAGYTGLSEWDKHLVDSMGNRPNRGGLGTPSNFSELSNPVYWTGECATEVYGSSVPIYAPNPYQSGSSLSHISELSLPNALMSPSIGLGETARAPLPVEWAMMQDMGWAVPEPATVALMVLGGLASIFRRR